MTKSNELFFPIYWHLTKNLFIFSKRVKKKLNSKIKFKKKNNNTPYLTAIYQEREKREKKESSPLVFD
jgi:hypothetical protein